MKKILVTGATSGIGYAVTCDLLQKGYQVWPLGRNQQVLSQLDAAGLNEGKCITFDLLNFDEYRTLINELPIFDGFVFSAGIVNNNPLKFFSAEKHRELIDINLNSPIIFTAELVRAGKMNNGASIVYLSSITGPSVGMKGIASYAASKAALAGASKAMALELASKLIRVNCVSPGMVETELVSSAKHISSENKRIDMAKYPLGNRYAQPQEIADLIEYLLGSKASFITGQNFTIDGGFTLN